MSTDPATQNWTQFERCFNAGHRDWLDVAEKCSNFVLGDQWTDEELAALGDRPALTLNAILRTVNAIKGQYGEEQADFDFKPRRRGATSEVATTLNRLVNHICETNDYHDRVEPQVFDDGVIEDRGYFDVRLDYSENILGEVKITSRDPRTVVLDADAREYDPETWKQILVYHWLTLDDIEIHYGKKARQSVESIASSPDWTFGDMSVKYETFGDKDWFTTPDEPSLKYVRIIERQHRKLAKVREFYNPVTGETRPVPEHWNEERVRLVRQNYRLGVRTRLAERIRWTVSADHVTLYDEWSDYDHFTVVPYFPYFRRGRPSGVVRHQLDPQEQLNKIESQVLHTINTTANSGWVVEAGSLVNMDADELEQRGAESGLVLIYGKNRQPPAKIESNQIPTGLEQFSSKALQYVHQIPGAESLMGQQPDYEVSGVALEQAQKRALLGMRPIFDSLRYSRKLVARRILECVQKFYTEQRVYFVTDWRDPEAPQEQILLNQQTASQIVNDVTIGEYEVVVSTMPARDTWQDAQFAQMVELRNANVMIPDHHVILASNLHGKQQIAEQVKQLQGLGEQSPAQQKQAELELRKLQAEVSEMEAKAQNLMANAQLDQAKAQTEVAGEQRETADMQMRYQMELARLKADIQKKLMDIENDQQLAAIHTDAKQDITRYQQLMQQNEKEQDRQNDLRKVLVQQDDNDQNRQADLAKAGLQRQTELDKLRAQAMGQQKQQQGTRARART